MSYFKFYRTNFYDSSNYIQPRRILDEAVLVNNVDVHLLTEELHSFEGQLDLTKEVSEHIYFMLNRDITSQVYHPQSDVFNSINITIEPNTDNTIKAVLTDFNIETKNISMVIYINKL